MKKNNGWSVAESEMLACCGSKVFAKEMVKASPFGSLSHAISSARDIWFNKVDVKGYLEAFDAHPQIGQLHTSSSCSMASSWSKTEQSTALATATSLTLEELADYNAKYKQRFGFIFLTCSSGRSSGDMLDELKKRIVNKPIKELEIAIEEQMKITELRMEKLFNARSGNDITSLAGSRVAVIGGHITESPVGPPTRGEGRQPITTHVLDVSQGKPARGVEVSLEMWKGPGRPSFKDKNGSGWEVLGLSETGADGRSGWVLSGGEVEAGTYRISFNTTSYCPSSFFPYVSILFEIREDQRKEHFHVPLIFSPFSYSTYRGS